MSFTAPYRWRLCTCILGTEIEIVRFKRQIYHSDETFWTAQLSSPWWWERSLPERECITSRVRLPNRRPRPIHSLKPQERERLEAEGLRAEYKV